MTPREFFQKVFSRYVVLNLLAMALFIVLIVVGVALALSTYTHHGEGIGVPDLTGVRCSTGSARLQHLGLLLSVSDSAYNREKPAGTILQQTPGPGTLVKSGHTIYVTINSTSSPSFAIPDIIDNCSAREAKARLEAIGYRLLPNKEVNGEKDWVYGLEARGHALVAGDKVSIETPLQLLVGNGLYEGYLYDDDPLDSLYDTNFSTTDALPIEVETIEE